MTREVSMRACEMQVVLKGRRLDGSSETCSDAN